MSAQITKEKRVVNADGSVEHSVTVENKDGRSLGDKLEDAKQAFQGDNSNLVKETKDKTEVKRVDGRDVERHEHREELKDPRSLGDKISDAENAFSGK